MDELLQKLLENDILNEDTKGQIKEAFDAKLKALEEQHRADIEAEVKLTLAEKYAADKEALIDAIDTKLDEMVQEEIAELKEDIERFRDLEAEYAQKLVEERKQMAQAVKEDMASVLEALDAYVEMRLASEMEELRESIEEVRKEEHGRRVLKMIGEEYRRMFTEEGDLEAELAELREERQRVANELKEVREHISGIERERKMEEVLESLGGYAREVMEAILVNVPTEKLDEAYKRYIGRVLHEQASTKGSRQQISEKDEKVLAENTEEVVEENLRVVTGDRQVVSEDTSDEAPAVRRLDESTLQSLRKLSGLDN